MAYVVKTTTTKQAGIQWFGQANPAASFRLNQWIKMQPGVLSSVARVTAPNELTVLTVYQDQAAYEALQAAFASNADAQARVAYATAQNFVTTTEVLA